MAVDVALCPRSPPEYVKMAELLFFPFLTKVLGEISLPCGSDWVGSRFQLRKQQKECGISFQNLSLDLKPGDPIFFKDFNCREHMFLTHIAA